MPPDGPAAVTTPEEFRATLARLGFSQSSFARWMVEMGDGRDEHNILRAVQRMLAGDSRISGEMRVLLALLDQIGGVEAASARLRQRSPVARRHRRAGASDTVTEKASVGSKPQAARAPA